MGGLKKFVIAAAVSAFAWTPSPAGADVVFRATCGSLKGHRVNMDPNGKSNIEKWTPELYPAGPPPNGTGTLTFLSDSTDTGHIRVKWTSDEQLLPIAAERPRKRPPHDHRMPTDAHRSKSDGGKC